MDIDQDFPMFNFNVLGNDDIFDKEVLTRENDFSLPAERQNLVKTEKELKAKDVVLAERQLAVGFENGSSQLEQKPSIKVAILKTLGQPPLPENVTFQDNCLPNFEPNKLEELIASDHFESIDIYPLASEKERNPPYLIKGKDITTKNDIPVSFMIEGCKPQDKVRISMRFCDELNKDMPVKCCKMHSDGNGKRPSDLPSYFNFYLTTKCSYLNGTEDALNHPTAEIDLKDQVPAIIDGKFKFSIVFLCLNSCHRQLSKQMELVVIVYNSDWKDLYKKECIDIRVCKNVKRDHREKSQPSNLKRKCVSSDDEPQTPQKVKMTKAKLLQDIPPIDNSGSSQQQEPSFVFQMKSKTDRTTILTLIERLGGEYQIQPRYEITAVEILDESDNHVNITLPTSSHVQSDPFVDLIEKCSYEMETLEGYTITNFDT